MLIILILVCGSNIFICTSDEEVKAAFKTITEGKRLKNPKGDIITDSLKEDVLTYYEYMQFKRAIFNCDTSKIEYRSQTGRIKCMTFDFTGYIN